MRPENEHDMVLWKHISRGGGKPPPSGSCSTVITRRFAGSRPTGSATAPLPKRSYWTPLRISGSMPGNSASRLPSGPICSAPCATARSTGFATNAPTASPSRDCLLYTSPSPRDRPRSIPQKPRRGAFQRRDRRPDADFGQDRRSADHQSPATHPRNAAAHVIFSPDSPETFRPRRTTV